MTAEYKGKQYKQVNLTRLLPFLTKKEYISVSYLNSEGEFREIGVIKCIDELATEQMKLVDTFLEFKYYMPEITKITSAKENSGGHLFVDVETSAGKKRLCIRDWYSNFRMLNKETLYIVDADGNKYFAPDISKLDRKSKAFIDLFV